MDTRSDSEIRNKQIKVLQETIRNLQRKLIETNAKEMQHESKISELEESLRESNVKELLLRTKIANARTSSQSITNDDTNEQSVAASMNGSSNSTESQLISFATAYLVIHPKGADFNAILNYVEQFLSNTTANELQEVFLKNEKLFSTDESGKKWFFTGFNQSSL
jgi:septal ring factor EnvC (AmiA/AmiB activator)